jgi:hypothetical protein
VIEVISDPALLDTLGKGAIRTSRAMGTEAMCDRVIEVYRQVISEQTAPIEREPINV